MGFVHGVVAHFAFNGFVLHRLDDLHRLVSPSGEQLPGTPPTRHSRLTAIGDACLAELNGLLQSNRLIHTVGRRLPLRDVALGHELSERGEVLGNIVLDIG